MVTPFHVRRLAQPAWKRECGFTAIELLVATGITVVVLAGAVAITSQVQQGYRRQVEDSVAIQEGRFALEWIGRLVRGAGNNPFNRVVGVCPADPTAFEAIRFDPDGNGENDDIRLQADSNPSDGSIGGDASGCNQANEDVTISFDSGTNVIEFLDNNLGGEVSTRTDNVIDNLEFIYRDSAHNVTAVEADVVYVEVRVTVRTRTEDAAAGAPVTRTLSSDIRVRSR